MLTVLLNWLSGGVLTSVLGHLEKRAALQNDRERMQTEITIEQVKAELATRLEQASIVKLQLGHWISWLPRFLIEGSVALYFMSHVVDSIWNLSGDVQPLQPAEAALMATVVAGLFISSAFGRKG
jgi:hypothetical protein